MDGNITDAIIHTYGDAIGISWFYFILVFTTITLAYIRTRNITYPLLLTLVFLGVGWAYLPAESWGVLGIFSAVALAIILYKVLK